MSHGSTLMTTNFYLISCGISLMTAQVFLNEKCLLISHLTNHLGQPYDKLCHRMDFLKLCYLSHFYFLYVRKTNRFLCHFVNRLKIWPEWIHMYILLLTQLVLTNQTLISLSFNLETKNMRQICCYTAWRGRVLRARGNRVTTLT